jgi:hypothetical protein
MISTKLPLTFSSLLKQAKDDNQYLTEIILSRHPWAEIGFYESNNCIVALVIDQPPDGYEYVYILENNVIKDYYYDDEFCYSDNETISIYELLGVANDIVRFKPRTIG